MLRHILVLLAALLASVDLVTSSCGLIGLPECDCQYPRAKRFEIHCENQDLSTLPPKGNYTLNDGYVDGNFSFNKIYSIPDFYFYSMRHYDILDFTSNKLRKISDLMFRGLETQLSSLNLSDNRINSIAPQTFRQYIRLKDLDLSKNYLEEPCFLHTADVSHLSLAGNGITTLRDQCFPDSMKVTHLDLSRNKITFIGDEAFDGLESLQHLDLSDNELSDIGSGLNSLVKHNNFVYLSLRHNKLEYMSSICKYRFKRMQHLDFGYNKLNDIQKYCFEAYSFLDGDASLELNFEHNRITALAASVFAGLKNRLHRLHLNDNQIESVNIRTFADLRKLEYLNLNSNNLDRLDFLQQWDDNMLTELLVANNDIEELSRDTFTTMKNMVRLDLDGNRLVTIESGTFKGMSALHDLSLRNNLLTNMDDNALEGLQGLQRLKISGNALITLKNCTFSGLINLLQFHFDDNLLYCDCDLLWLLQFIASVNSRGMPDEDIKEPVLEGDCYYPESARGQYMQNVVSEKCTKHPGNACFGLKTSVGERNQDYLANATWKWPTTADNAAAKDIFVSLHNAETGNLDFNESLYGVANVATLQLNEKEIYKVSFSLNFGLASNSDMCTYKYLPVFVFYRYVLLYCSQMVCSRKTVPSGPV